jgi:hypothetical protein
VEPASPLIVAADFFLLSRRAQTRERGGNCARLGVGVIIQTIRLHGDRYLESQFSAEAVEGTRIEETRKFEVEVECSTGVDSMSRSRPVSLGSGKPGHMGRRVTLRSRIALESLVPSSVRWVLPPARPDRGIRKHPDAPGALPDRPLPSAQRRGPDPGGLGHLGGGQIAHLP